MKRAAQRGLAMPCVPVTPFADKTLRIERLQPPVKQGLIRFHNSQSTLIDQFEQWPNDDHDDGPDCVEMLWAGALDRAEAQGGGHRLVRRYLRWDPDLAACVMFEWSGVGWSGVAAFDPRKGKANKPRLTYLENARRGELMFRREK